MIINKKITNTLNVINEMWENSSNEWLIAFSGGKDSTLVLLMMLEYLKMHKNVSNKNINVVYCDTGVEIPIIREYTLDILNKLDLISKQYKLNIKVKITKPDLKDTFFVKVLGNGYVPPSFMFRWCTDRLRTRPLQKVANGKENLILLGTRKNESIERDRVLKQNQISDYVFRQRNYANSVIFSPILDYSIDEIWKALELLNKDNVVDLQKLKFLYKGTIGGDSISNLGGRFGCWVCTVVRKDKATENLLGKGYNKLSYLIRYRNLLIEYKSDPKKRLINSKTKEEGKGPFSLETRKKLLQFLLEAQKFSGYELISIEEIKEIKNIWKKERNEVN